jgi:hypothetical protein
MFISLDYSARLVRELMRDEKRFKDEKRTNTFSLSLIDLTQDDGQIIFSPAQDSQVRGSETHHQSERYENVSRETRLPSLPHF